MRAVIQRVKEASVEVEGVTLGQIGQGLVVLVGVGKNDTEAQARQLAEKIANLRIFADEASKFNISALEISAEVLVISQFTLYGDARKGRRPNFVEAAPPTMAEPLVEQLAESFRKTGLKVETGRFGAHMVVRISNDGPVTIILDV